MPCPPHRHGTWDVVATNTTTQNVQIYARRCYKHNHPKRNVQIQKKKKKARVKKTCTNQREGPKEGEG